VLLDQRLQHLPRACSRALAFGPADTRTYHYENQFSSRLRSFGFGPVPSGTSRFSIAGSGHLFSVFGCCRCPSGRGGEAAYKRPLRRTPIQPSGRIRFALGRVSGSAPPGNSRLRRLAGRGRSSSEERASRTGVTQSESWPVGFGRLDPLFQDRGLLTTSSGVRARSVELAQRGLATSGCNLNWFRLFEVQVPLGP